MSQATPVITRFAPSPTGLLHIGGVRTALLNLLYARRHAGQYLVRIEDTDRKRSTAEAMNAITQGLDWLGLAGDQPILLQSTRLQRHREVAQMLLDTGKAYYCDCSPEELAAQRETARAEGRTRLYDRRNRDRGLKSGVLRIKMPIAGETVLHDAIQGSITIQNDHLDDYIILRADGSPTYMLSCVVDDGDMQISHIIRGDDHTVNAFRQYHLLKAIGYTAPVYAHLGLLHGSDGAKLSKRHGALGVDYYRQAGYLPEALNSFLMRLGWGKGSEVLSVNEAADIFALEQLNKAPSRIDFHRLDHLNAQYLRDWAENAPETLIDRLASYAQTEFDELQKQRLESGLAGLSQRAEKLQDLWQAAQFYLQPVVWPLVDQKAEQQFLKKVSGSHIDILQQHMRDWSFESRPWLQEKLQDFVAAHEISFGQLGQPLRIALAGSMQAPEIQDILFTLGKQEALCRIQSALDWMKQPD